MELSELRKEFGKIYGYTEGVRFFAAPARVNLIGEHTDHNGGYVFPAALTQGTIVAAAPRKDSLIRLAAMSLPGVLLACPLEMIPHFAGKGWGAYQLGVALKLTEAGYAVPGCDMLFWGDVPFGAGLSSSASIEVTTALALSTLGLPVGAPPPDLVRLAVIAQHAENQFVGVQCGIMDQFASACGKANHAILLDCASLHYQLVRLDLEDCRLVIANTNKSRSLTGSKYNERRAECMLALSSIQKVRPEIKNLCQLTPAELEALESFISDHAALLRARHAVQENARVLQSMDALGRRDLPAFGRLMVDSHLSLRDQYEVTGQELDAMFEEALAVNGVLGSRMTGAGFGGCTVSLVRESAVETFIRQVGEGYQRRTGLIPTFTVSCIGDGAREL